MANNIIKKKNISSQNKKRNNQKNTSSKKNTNSARYPSKQPPSKNVSKQTNKTQDTTKKTINPKEITYEYFDNAKLKQEANIKPKTKKKKENKPNEIKEKEKKQNISLNTNKKQNEKKPKIKKKLKTKYKKIVESSLLILFMGIFIFSTAKLLAFKQELKETKEESESLIEETIAPPKEIYEEVTEEEKIEDMQIDFQKLKDTNQDIVGWMVFNNKNVHNPLVQTTDNEYYLTHSFKNKENSVGSLFVDYRNKPFEDENTIIFGHQTPNNTMFGSLEDVFKKGFFDEENRDIIYIFDTEHRLRKYKIFSYYVIETEEYYITPSFKEEREYNEFLKTLKRRSFKNLDVEVTTKDKILTLSTCAGPHGTTKRRVIHAKLLS